MRRAIIRQTATTHSILTPRKYTTFVNSGQVQSKQMLKFNKPLFVKGPNAEKLLSSN
jgi:hypothetical protein